MAVVLQIVSTMALELPSFLTDLENLRGISPNVHLNYEPWGHMIHEDVNCSCQSSRTAAYVHDLTINGRGPVHSLDTGWPLRVILGLMDIYALSPAGRGAGRD